MSKIVVKFTQLETSKTLEIPIISKYTVITGLSGEGKSHFYNYVLDSESPFVKTECELPVITATSENINAIFDMDNKMKRTIIFIYEVLLKQHKVSEKLINQSNHLLVSISRDIPFIGYAPIQSLFAIEHTIDNWFSLELLMIRDNFKISRSVKDYNFIVTEARENRSEHEFLTNWSIRKDIPIISASNKDRIHSILNDLNKKYDKPSILVLTDLANFGLQYKILAKRCRENPNITFYDYLSFEEMLFVSDFLSGETELDCFDFVTLEKFYEKALQQYTQNTEMRYEHGKPLSPCFLSECNECSVCSHYCTDKFKTIVGEDSALLKLQNKNKRTI